MKKQDSTRMVKRFLIITCWFAALTIITQGQAVVPEARNTTVWTPQTMLAVASVIFSFGVSWQTLRVQGKILKNFEEWRANTVDPTLNGHETRITVLEAHDPVRKHGPSR